MIQITNTKQEAAHGFSINFNGCDFRVDDLECNTIITNTKNAEDKMKTVYYRGMNITRRNGGGYDVVNGKDTYYCAVDCIKDVRTAIDCKLEMENDEKTN
jgi:hypothetical protein